MQLRSGFLVQACSEGGADVKMKSLQATRSGIGRTTEDYIMDALAVVISIFVLIITIYPFWYVLVISFNEGIDASLGGIYFLPRKYTLDNYQGFLTDAKWLMGFGVTVSRTVVGSFIGVIFTTLFAYGLSFKDLMYRKVYMTLLIISMYFSGGIIPYYAVLSQLHLINTFWVYVIPGAINTFFVMVAISFFGDIPSALRESAIIDGASELQVFFRIILPLSKPFIATLVLFVGVGHWNNWYDSAFFIRSKELRTLSYLMMEVINKSKISAVSASFGASSTTTSMSVQTAAMVIAVVPIICVYPFLQKHFVKGIMIGSVKG